MEVAADDRLDLGMAGDHRGERAPLLGGQVDPIPVDHRRGQGWVVHGDDRRLRRGSQRGVEPLQLSGIEAATVLAGKGRVDDHQPQRAEVDGIVERRVPLARGAENLPHRRPVVVVAGQDVDRHPELADHLRRQSVLLRLGVLGEVAGDKDRAGRVRQPLQCRDHRA